MIGQHFYHETLKTATAAFGSIFNAITIKRRDGTTIPVPISYGPRTKWLEAHRGSTTDEIFENLLPRMSYEMVALSYDGQRKLSNKQQVVGNIPYDPERKRRPAIHTPVPYTLDFTLYIQTKTLNDGWQIVEQILPFFTPAYTLTVKHFPSTYLHDENDEPLENVYDMPILLTACTWTDDWTGDVADRRMIEWTLEFTCKVNLFGPVNTRTSIIYDSRAVISAVPTEAILAAYGRGTVPQEGVETGWAVIDSDSKYVGMTAAEQEIIRAHNRGSFTNTADSDFISITMADKTLSPNIINMIDSDGYTVKIIRDFEI